MVNVLTNIVNITKAISSWRKTAFAVRIFRCSQLKKPS